MIGHYQAEYRPANLLMVIRSLAWFDDADVEPNPVTLNEKNLARGEGCFLKDP